MPDLTHPSSGEVEPDMTVAGAAEKLPSNRFPLRFCDYCNGWNSRPCGEGCVWSPKLPTLEDIMKDIP